MTSSLDQTLSKAMQASKERHQRLTQNTNKTASKERDHRQNSVVKSNELARAFYKVTLNEKRLMELLISRIHPQRTDNDYQHIEISAKMFADTFKLARQNAYRDLLSAAQGLQEVFISLEYNATQGERFNLIGRVAYDQKRAIVTCSVQPWAIPHLVGLKGRFTQYTLAHGADFKSAHAWRFFELLVSWSCSKSPLQGSKKISVEELRKLLEIPDSYPFSMFKRRILLGTQEELRERLNIQMTIEYIKPSRKVTDLWVRFVGKST